MKKCTTVFANTILISSFFFLLQHSVQASVINSKVWNPMASIHFPAQLNFDTRGFSGNGFLPIQIKPDSLWYSDLRFKGSYSGGSLLASVGGGYRQLVQSLGLIGGYLHLDAGRLLPQFSYYGKLNLGFEIHTLKSNTTFNLYLPILSETESFNSLNKHYEGHQEYWWRYFEPNRFGCEYQSMINFLDRWEGKVGVYYNQQSKHSNLWGGIGGVSYHWNPFWKVFGNLYLDNFNGWGLSAGVSTRNRYRPSAPSRAQQMLWRMLESHIAPTQVKQQEFCDLNAYHLFFDSNAKETEHSKASYEYPAPILNRAMLEHLRKSYPENARVTLHLSGFFDLAQDSDASLPLRPYEYLKGECSAFDRLNMLGLSLEPHQLTENVSESSALNTLRLLSQYQHIPKGWPVIKGAVLLNSHTKISEIALLPATGTQDSTVNIKTIDQDENMHRQSSAITIEGQEDGSPAEEVTIRNVEIRGWPLYEKPYQYLYGIDIDRCDSLVVDSVWIDNAETGIFLRNAQQVHSTHLKNIYIGSHHLSYEVERTRYLKEALKNIVTLERAGTRELAYCEHQKLLDVISHRSIDPDYLLKYVTHIDKTAFPESVTLRQLPLDSQVAIGMHAEGINLSQEKNSSLVQSQDKLRYLPGKFKEWTGFLKNKLGASRDPFSDGIKASSIHVADSLIIGKVLSVAVQNRFYVTLCRSILGSQYLGYYVNNAQLSLVGNTGWDNFVYLYYDDPHRLREIANQIPLLKGINTRWAESLPYILCVEGQEDKTALTSVNTSAIMIVPRNAWMIGKNLTASESSSSLHNPFSDASNALSIIYPKDDSPKKNTKPSSAQHTRQSSRTFPGGGLMPLQLLKVHEEGRRPKDLDRKSSAPVHPARPLVQIPKKVINGNRVQRGGLRANTITSQRKKTSSPLSPKVTSVLNNSLDLSKNSGSNLGTVAQELWQKNKSPSTQVAPVKAPTIDEVLQYISEKNLILRDRGDVEKLPPEMQTTFLNFKAGMRNTYVASN